MPDVCSVAKIKAAVCAEFNISIEQMLSHARPRRIARPRQVAMYLCHKLSRHGCPWIAIRFERHHTTILHAAQHIPVLMTADPEFALRVAAIEARLTAPQSVEHF